MPTINIPAKVRFALYLVAAVGSVVVAYLFAKGYVGEAETGLWAGLVAIINGLAAAKTDLHESNGVWLEGEVPTAGDIDGRRWFNPDNGV